MQYKLLLLHTFARAVIYLLLSQLLQYTQRCYTLLYAAQIYFIFIFYFYVVVKELASKHRNTCRHLQQLRLKSSWFSKATYGALKPWLVNYDKSTKKFQNKKHNVKNVKYKIFCLKNYVFALKLMDTFYLVTIQS